VSAGKGSPVLVRFFFTDVEEALRSRDVTESLVRVRQLLRIEPVIHNYVTAGNGA
jgi:hypothetical protein